jgi:hypothetical protein
MLYLKYVDNNVIILGDESVDNGRFNSFWSCLEDNEEDIKEESCVLGADSG